METLFETYVLDGGPLMVVLLLCSLVLVTIVIRDLIRFQPNRVLPPRLLKDGEGWSRDSDLRKVGEQLRSASTALSSILLDLTAGCTMNGAYDGAWKA